MKMGFAAPVSGSWATADNLLHVARRADELGYHSLWTFQRLLSPVDASWGESYRSVLDPVVALAHVAATTSRIRLGTAILNIPLAGPTVVAKQLATLDVLSGGRVDAGLGLGWAPEEFAAAGVAMEHRGRRGEEFVTVLRKLWTDDVVQHDGEFYSIPASRADPKPVQRPHPPILLGGAADVALRRIGRIADGWISSSRTDLTTIGTSVALIRESAERAGRDPDALRFVCRGVVRVRDDERAPLTGTVEQIRGDLADLAERGITELFVDLNFDPLVGSPDADPVRSAEHADEVLVSFAPGR
ncbi:TIGR03619 family F420-dependent LLM class oxidoreductase [Umezawaea beigongshangensis]|uniref:TIGR03619 family F420-dependent LLM class oxidoreductase n=1 Tax=Umezawaea beigongshangensis TaxID=2780383 RepID=UPI0018F26CA5|nr:TIGR03619 family F420-dependent LLM class oxidoreductase [Umezawaea beigongshangensis]